VVTKLLMKAAARLRDEKMKCHCLFVYVKCLDGTCFENTVYFSETHDTYFLVAQLKKLWRIERNKKPLKVAIALSDLTDGPVQMSLFDSPKSNGINLALDKVNSRFGANSLYLASTTEVLGSAKTRISFNHIPKLSDEFDEVP
jgi:DNA polymerase IV